MITPHTEVWVSMQLTTEQIRDRFRVHGLRTTRQREVLYGLLTASTGHPTAEELFQSVRSIDSGLSLATVYNTLDALLECKLCRKLNPRDGGPARYDADLSEHAHIATHDGRFIDIPEDLSRELLSRLGPDLLGQIEGRMGLRVESVSLQLNADSITGPHVHTSGGPTAPPEHAQPPEPDPDPSDP